MIASALGAAAGCVRKPEAAPRGGAPVTLRWFASSTTDSRQDFRQPLINAFQKAHPLIRIEAVPGPMNTDEKRGWIRDTITGKGPEQPPDVYLGDVIWPAEFASTGLAMQLDGRLPASFWSRFPEELVEGASYRGKSYAAPFFADQSVLLYRKDLLEREGLPNPPKTWNELFDACRTLVQKKRIKHGFVWQGAAYEGLTCVWAEFAAHANAEMTVSPDGRLRVDTPQALEALEFMRRLLTGGASPAAVTGYRETQALQVFESGQAAFLRSWNPETAKLNPPVRDRVGVTPLPSFDGEPGSRASTVGGWSLFVNPNTRHLPQVLTFIDWITDFPAQYTIAQYTKIPTNAAVRADRVVKDNPVLAASTTGRPVHRPAATPAYPRVSQVLYSEINRALSGAVAPAAALREAQRRIDLILR